MGEVHDKRTCDMRGAPLPRVFSESRACACILLACFLSPKLGSTHSLDFLHYLSLTIINLGTLRWAKKFCKSELSLLNHHTSRNGV